MTKEEKEVFEDEQKADLLEFAECLDFDQYIYDLEFREAVTAMKDRAGRVQKEQDAFKQDLVEEFNKLQGDEEDGAEAGDGDGLSSSAWEDGLEGTSLGDPSEAASLRRKRRAKEGRDADGGPPEWDASTTAGDPKERPDEAT